MGANIFDIIIIVLLVFGAFKGFSNGLIASAASLIALFLGIWGAIKFSTMVAGYLSQYIEISEKYLGIVAFAITFLGIIIAVHFIAKAVEGLAEAVSLGIANKVFGAAFGAIKIAFILSVIITVINSATNNSKVFNQEMREKSLFYKPVASMAPFVFKHLQFDQIKKGIQDKTATIAI